LASSEQWPEFTGSDRRAAREGRLCQDQNAGDCGCAGPPPCSPCRISSSTPAHQLRMDLAADWVTSASYSTATRRPACWDATREQMTPIPIMVICRPRRMCCLLEVGHFSFDGPLSEEHTMVDVDLARTSPSALEANQGACRPVTRHSTAVGSMRTPALRAQHHE
jgi:hypothetical protein